MIWQESLATERVHGHSKSKGKNTMPQQEFHTTTRVARAPWYRKNILPWHRTSCNSKCFPVIRMLCNYKYVIHQYEGLATGKSKIWPQVEIFWKCKNTNITPWYNITTWQECYAMVGTSCHYKSIFLRQECHATTSMSPIDKRVLAWKEHTNGIKWQENFAMVGTSCHTRGFTCDKNVTSTASTSSIDGHSKSFHNEKKNVMPCHRIRNMPQQNVWLQAFNYKDVIHRQVPCYVKSVWMKNVKSSEENHTMARVFFHNKSILLV